MFYSFFRFGIILTLLAAATLSVSAQTDASGSNPLKEEDLPKGIKENLAKGRIEREKKDYQELLDRGAEAAKLSDEINASFVKNNALGTDDRKKLERLEKLSKKICEELGAKDFDSADADADDKLISYSDAFDKLKNISTRLSGELKKSTRYTISAVAIQSSNAVLRIVRFLRQNNN